LHLASSSTPSSCLPCHQGERPTSTAGCGSSTWRTSPFDFATHGAGLDCATCHAGPGTGAWGTTQNWVGGNFAHSASSLAASTCIACHSTQRPVPALLTSANAALPPGVQFDHSTATGDCIACHVTGSSLAARTCVACHTTQRPEPALLTSANAALPAGVQFDHSTATGDCIACHVSGSFSGWTGGKLHLVSSSTPSSCLPCHQGERPI